MIIREQIEKIERAILSPYAALSERTRGRERKIEPCELRTEFQRDRDRIIHSKAFRRLKHKTQVFIAPQGDHYRTRLTHTLEVSQIARTIARSLRLNEDLTEAISLGHDLGHTPFGHSGEAELNILNPNGFRHYEQSLRVVDVLEGDGGLNLTWEVRDGILNHTGANRASTLEGIVVKYADKIAYINHDIDDAVRGGILSYDDLPKECVKTLGIKHGERINNMICDIVRSSKDSPEIRMSPEIEEAMLELRQFLFDNVYIGSKAKTEEGKARWIIKNLYEYFIENPEKLPNYKESENVHTLVSDYISGMSDRFAIAIFNDIFVPKSWNKL